MVALRFAGVAALLLGTIGAAGAAPVAPAAKSARPEREITRAVLGQGTIELGGPWRFHTGDDLNWARADLDDSQWATIDLSPPPGSANTALGTSGFIPGWTASGYPKYSGYAWYRLRVDVDNTDGALAIKMPDSVDDAYELFVNGQRIGEFGKFTSHGVTAYSALPRSFPLPKTLRSGPMVIAVRMWMDSATPFNSPDAGGMHGPPVLGHAGVIATQMRMDWDRIAHTVGSGFLEMLLLVLAGIVAASLFSMDRTEPAHLALALVCVATILANGVVLLGNFSTAIPQLPGVILADVLFAPLRIAVWVLFWAYWFRIVHIRWVHGMVWGLAALLMLGTAMLRPPLYGQVVPVGAAGVLFPALLTVKLLMAALLIVITVYGIRKSRAEGWTAMAAVLLVGISLYQRELRLLHIRIRYSLFDFNLSLGTIATIVSLCLITVMLLRRFLQGQRRREQWKAEIEQARQVQHVLIPHELPTVPGFVIESEYRPAREVGGDFFQILPLKEDGSVLIVVGDVTGKGLQAGMLVALIVGAIRTAVEYHTDPVHLLNTLNERLCGRGRASATCMILRIAPDGAVTLANAGHLPPYWNGEELEMEGALPIGVASDPDFPVMHFQLAPGDRLMLMSDGLAEAQDRHGKLFGFDRIQEMVRGRTSAVKLADAAQAFGQEDDILVLEIRRNGGGRDRLETSAVLTAT